MLALFWFISTNGRTVSAFFLCISSIHNIIYCMYHVTLKMVHTMMTKRNNITLDVNKSVAIEEYATWTISLK